MQEFDIAIIGAGPGGYVAAIYGARLGARVALIEKDTEGGTCLNRGCIPTKALIRTTEIYKTLQEANRYGCLADNVRVDYKRAVSRKDRVVGGLVKGVQSLLAKGGVTVLKGSGQLVDAHTIKVIQDGEETLVQAKNMIIATGSEPAQLPIPGATLDFVMDSTQALELEELPESLVIIGGGVIGMEFAFIFGRLGVKVTLIEYLDEVLALLDSDLTQDARRNLRMAGVKLHTGAKVTSMEASPEGGALVHFESVATGEAIPSVKADKVLMAVGRRPFLGDLGVEELGIEIQAKGGGIVVNDLMQTSIRHIYAIGDVTGGMMLAHVASHQAIVAINNIMGQEEHLMDYRAVPNAIFTDPEIATVGLSEKEAEAHGLEIRVGRFPFAGNGKALALGNSRGFVKLIADAETGILVGGGVVGPGATDLIAEITLAVQQGLTAEQVANTIHAHPTLPEAIMEAAWDIGSGALHLAD
ncbi:MAG: dihydrolipoyl dehydrogenase [Firmicutes bacterium]|nr:dihydrolipoyl dehydrogenase [Bacillota bacterium]